MDSDDEILTKIREAIAYLEDIAGIDRKNWMIVHTMSPYNHVADSYRIIDVTNFDQYDEDYIEGESMFISDTLEDLLWKIEQMY